MLEVHGVGIIGGRMIMIDKVLEKSYAPDVQNPCRKGLE